VRAGRALRSLLAVGQLSKVLMPGTIVPLVIRTTWPY